MMQATLTRTEKQEALSAFAGITQGQVVQDGTQVYIPQFARVKMDGLPIKIARVQDVDEALTAFKAHKGENVVLLLKYTDGSHIVTAVDCRREKFIDSWLDDHPTVGGA